MLAETARGSTGQNATEARARRESPFEAFNAGRQVVQDGDWPAWSPMVQTHERGGSFCADVGCDYSFANNRYQKLVTFENAEGCLPRGQIEWPDWSPGNVSG